jgi:hypothetical protein
MRVFAGALLAVLATGPGLPGGGDVAVTVAVKPAAYACAVVSTGTIVAYDAQAPREVRYRFVRSDGSVSKTGRLTFSGDGAVAQSVRDQWSPHGASPWVALEIVAPEHVRSQRVAVTARCANGVLAASTR